MKQHQMGVVNSPPPSRTPWDEEVAKAIADSTYPWGRYKDMRCLQQGYRIAKQEDEGLRGAVVSLLAYIRYLDDYSNEGGLILHPSVEEAEAALKGETP